MPDVPWWLWGTFYALAGAANAAWFMREIRRNPVLESRVSEFAAVLEILFKPGFVRGLILTAMIVSWPIALLFNLFCDVPGHGKNIDEEERRRFGQNRGL